MFQDVPPGFHTRSWQINDERDLKLVLEVGDIINELKMIRYLLEKQRLILEALTSALKALNYQEVPDGTGSEESGCRATTQGIEGHARMHIMKGNEHFYSAFANIDLIKNEAEGTHKAVRNGHSGRRKTG